MVHLPRSVRDHLTNQPSFGPDGALYIPQPSNTAFGAPDDVWGNRPERLLSATILRLDVANTCDEPIDARTADGGGTYDPAAAGAPLTIETGRGPLEFRVEVAATPAERARGLMFREALADDHGMLFDFGDPQPVTMWMRNTFIPLDIIFIKEDRTIANIAENTVPLSLDPLPSLEPVVLVLEIAGGRSAELGIKAGDTVEWER